MKWQAKVTLDGKQNYLGLYDEVEDAAKVVKAFRALHMPFSKEGRENIL